MPPIREGLEALPVVAGHGGANPAGGMEGDGGHLLGGGALLGVVRRQSLLDPLLELGEGQVINDGHGGKKGITYHATQAWAQDLFPEPPPSHQSLVWFAHRYLDEAMLEALLQKLRARPEERLSREDEAGPFA